MDKNLALVSGGSKRIGLAISKFLLSQGYDIAVTHKTPFNGTDELSEAAASSGRQVFYYECDLSDLKQTELLMEMVNSDAGPVNLLINNASVFIKSKLRETDTDLLVKTTTINYLSPYILTRDFARQCPEGQVINILDTKAVKHGFAYSAYNISKKALLELTLQSANELAPGIRVNGICPGLILPPAGENDDYLNELAKNIPMKKKGGVDDIIGAAEFLLKSKYVTGQLLFIDGGQSIL